MTITEAATVIAPNPQLQRDNWIDLCGSWGFAHDDGDAGIGQNWWLRPEVFDRQIVVPFPSESELSGLRETGFHPLIWYRRSFTAPQLKTGDKLLLNFGAVDYAATVWVNGQCVGSHEGGHVPSSLDVTHALNVGEQVLVVRAEDQPQDVRMPRGKQDWLEAPHSIWYHRTSGIWQPVWLSVVPDLHLTDLHFTPDLAHARVRCDIRLSTVPAAPTSLTIRLSAKGKLIAEQTMMLDDSEFAFDIPVPQLENGVHREDLLWSPEKPNLVNVEVVLGGARPDLV